MIFLPIIIFFILLCIRVPVAFSIAIGALSFFIIDGGIPTYIFVQRLISPTLSFPLLAVPFFIMTGVIMNHSGITRRIMNLADVLVGHLVGGFAQINILMSTLMGGMSASANADAAMQSKIVVPEMTKRNYGPGFSASITACSAIIAAIIPPGIALVLYGFISGTSIGKLFLAGILPGILLSVLLMMTVRFMSFKYNYAPSRIKKATSKEIIKASYEAFYGLLIPIIIVGGIRFGVFTPTEAGAIAVAYSLFIGFFVHKELKIKSLPIVINESVIATSVILLIICAASSFGYYLTWERIPVILAEFMTEISNNPIILLLIINIFLLILGMFVEGTAALILLTPILVPIAKSFGIDPVHFGIILILNLSIAGATPPVGTLMFTTCSISNVKIEDYIKEGYPFIIATILALLLITYFPIISMLLPNLLM
jgi:tripartite ATP-independent transporter DctM subunit|tara:strand:+ start:303 stop:1583 length:1281 start_codon:yes stop_codon:yes gene_type:complete